MNLPNKQTIFMAIDDSGQLSKRDNIMTFGGIILPNIEIKKKFISEYSIIVKQLRKKYPKKYKELKYSNTKSKDRLLILNYLKNYLTFCCIIDNRKIYKSIFNKSKSKGRYLDYAIKIMIKNTIKNLIKENLINPFNNIELIISIDENNYKSNGYYNLKESIYEELKFGMSNIRNNIKFKNIIYGNLEIILNYEKSHLCYLVQSADIIAGYVRNNINNNISIEYINYKICLPNTKK